MKAVRLDEQTPTASAVLLTSYDSYILQNLSREKQQFEFRVAIINTDLFRASQHIHTVKNLRIGETRVNDRDIEKLTNVSDNIGLLYRYCKDIEPEDELEVSFEVTVVRNLDDTEFFYATYAQDGFTLQLKVDTDFIHDYGVFAIHESDLVCTQNARDQGYGEWKINDTVLPYQGVAFWWRAAGSGFDGSKSEGVTGHE